MIQRSSEKGAVDRTLGASSSSIQEGHQHEEIPTMRFALLGLGLDMPFNSCGHVLMRAQSVNWAFPQLFGQLHRGDESLLYWQGLR
jgi:hypothetical protein